MEKKIKIEGLEEIKTAIENLDKSSRLPFSLVDLQKWEKENREKELVEIKRKQAETNQKQIVLLEKQTRFNLILALATTVLAIGTFVEIILFFLVNKLDFTTLINIHWSLAIILIVGLLFFIGLIGIIIFILIKILFFNNKTENQEK